jgi:hypothetical protein
MGMNIKNDNRQGGKAKATAKAKAPKSNIFTDTTGVVAREGIHQATVTLTRHVGKTETIYGTKDFQMFHLEVRQPTDSGTWEIAEIHQQYHRSFHPQAALVKFLEGFGIKACRGMRVDFDDLVGKKLNIVVTHSTDANGIHANVRPLPLPASKGVSQ